MPTLKLTKRAVDKLPAPHPSGKQTLFWDTDLKGFAVLVSGKTTAKTYVVQHRLKPGLSPRITIGPTNVLEPDGEDGAKARARKLLGEFYSGVDPRAERRKTARRAVTLRAILDQYLEANKELRDKSRRDYRNSVERYLAPWLDLPLREITGEMVEIRHREIERAIAKNQPKRETAPGKAMVTGQASANAAMRALRLLWNFAAERDPELPANPVRRLKRQWFPVERRERMVRTDNLEVFYKAVDALPNRTHRDYLLLLLFTGLRRGEAAALRWDEEIDFPERIIRLPARRTKSGRKLDLPMTDFVRDLLITRRALGRDGPFVFPADSRSGHLAEPKFPLALVAETTGIAVSAHDLRRTFVTVAEGTDISPLALKALVNHALGGDVTAGYVQMTIDRLRGPAQRVCDRLKELCGIEEPAEVAKIGGHP
jgi:integrase